MTRRSRYPQTEYTASGKLIARLTHSLAKVKDWTLEETMSYIGRQTNKSSDMVYRWQQGRSLPKPEIIEKLAEVGFSSADMSREWCEELLDATNYANTANLINRLWGPKELRDIPNRLVRMEHTRLIGREHELQQLQELLSPRYAAYLIIIDGIGGVGKTALALDMAYQCLRASTGEHIEKHVPTFEAIIFVSAKQEYLTAQGILPGMQVHRTLRQIFQEVTQTLHRLDIRATPLQEQGDRVREALGSQRTLLIVDNLETMEDKQEILSFLYELPPTVKVVVTTRERAMFAPIRLEQLAEEAALELIEQQAADKQVVLGKGEPKMLYQGIGGIPAALVYAIGQRAAGYTLETVLRNIPKADGDVARFCFQGSVDPLRDTPTHLMLMAFALFPQLPTRSAVSYVAGLETDTIAAEEALSQLQRLSLIREADNRFRMLPLTREYALAEMGRYPDFEREARQRWIEFYQRYALKYGGHDMQEWHLKFDHLETEWENLLAVFDWCAHREEYDIIKFFWCTEEPGSVVDFTTTYGFWDDRLNWLAWLMNTAGARGDWPVVLDTLTSYAYTLTLISRFEEADEHFKRGYRLCAQSDAPAEARLLLNHGNLYVFMKRFDEADHLFDQATAIVQQLPEPLHTRYMLNIEYYRAGNYYWQENYKAARAGFSSTLHKATASGWHRVANYAQNYLADIAILEGRFEEAERLLESGLIMAERNHEKRRTFSYWRSFTNFYHKQGRLYEAIDSAKKAREGYVQLGIEQDIQRMDNLIKELRSSLVAR